MSMLLSNGRMVSYKFRRMTSVWLEVNQSSGVEMFNCPTCKAPVLQIQGDVVTMLPGESPSKLPIIIQCRNPMCGRKFQFHVMPEPVTE